MAKKNVLVHADMNHNEIQNVLLQKLATTPNNAEESQIWYNTTEKYPYFHDGTSAKKIGYLPPATTTTLGGVIVGNYLNVDGTGKINVDVATSNAVGAIRIASDAEVATGTATDLAVNPKQLSSAISSALVGALTYKGTWDITSATDFSGITLPVKQGYMYMVTGTGPKTIGGIEWNAGDYIVMDADVAAGGTITQVSKIDNTESSDIVRLATSQTLTNKTIDADDNTIQDLAVANFKSGVIVTSVGNPGTDTSMPTEKAVRSAISALKNTYTNGALTASGGVCTWTISTAQSPACLVAVYETVGGAEVAVDVTHGSGSLTIKINSASNIASGKYTAVVIG